MVGLMIGRALYILFVLAAAGFSALCQLPVRW
jgi:hypothetical protein